ncbi:MAG TPA: GDSL-type esterase/lipase family protein [Gemmatimonadaceae bacterium]
MIAAPHVPPSAPVAEVRFLALGDSYTIGEAVAENERWPVQLAALLRAQGVHVAAPTIIARTGWTTDELSAGIDAAQPSGPYDLVTLLIGVNNQYRGRSVQEFRSQLHTLVQRAVELAGDRASRVVIIAIPDWGVTAFAEGRDRARIAREIDAFNLINKREAAAAGAHFVDISPIARRAASEAALTAHDGLHPSGAMYAEWARLIGRVAREALKSTDK